VGIVIAPVAVAADRHRGGLEQLDPAVGDVPSVEEAPSDGRPVQARVSCAQPAGDFSPGERVEVAERAFGHAVLEIVGPAPHCLPSVRSSSAILLDLQRALLAVLETISGGLHHLVAPPAQQRLRDVALAADLRHRAVTPKQSQHQLDLLLGRELPVLAPVAQRELPCLVERPILRGAPDAISTSAQGSRLRPRPHPSDRQRP
jgi:hypothetical protein